MSVVTERKPEQEQPVQKNKQLQQTVMLMKNNELPNQYKIASVQKKSVSIAKRGGFSVVSKHTTNDTKRFKHVVKQAIYLKTGTAVGKTTFMFNDHESLLDIFSECCVNHQKFGCCNTGGKP